MLLIAVLLGLKPDVLRLVLGKLILALRDDFIHLFTSHGRLELDLVLLGHEIALVVVLGLESPRHFKLAPIVTHISASCELVGEPVVDHIFLNSIYNIYDIIDVLFELLTLLKTIHGDQIGFLISYGVQVAFH